MTPILIAGPAAEPVSLAAMKSYLRIDAADEDEYVASLVVASRLIVEAAAGRVLIDQSWRLALDRWPEGRVLRVPLAPFSACTAIRVIDAAGAAALVPAADYVADTRSEPGRIVFPLAPPLPGRAVSGIEVDIVAGYGATAADVPEPLVEAVRRLAAHWYEHRGDAVLAEAAALPAGIAALVAPYRRGRL